MEIGKLTTEARNPRTSDIDSVSAFEMMKMINEEDKQVAFCIEKKLHVIAEAVDRIAEKYTNGGRLVYCGAGTSGRLGVMDAAECPPTYGVSADEVVGLMAGGSSTIQKAREGAEDSKELGEDDLREIGFSAQDVLVGIAASGRTPYVIGAIEYAKSLGALTVSLTCNENCPINDLADIAIAVEVGPEVISGSTRMKAGTAQKLVLNMISTGVMVKTGKVYGNLMVNMKASNEKLVDRAVRMIRTITDVDEKTARQELEKNNRELRTTVFCLLSGLARSDALEVLERYKGHIKKALHSLGK